MWSTSKLLGFFAVTSGIGIGMKVLLLHGFLGNSNLKKFLLEVNGFCVCRPRLSNLSFSKAVKQAQRAYDAFQPDVVIGSSRGAAVALNLQANTPLVLLSPAYKRFGTVCKTINPLTIIHGNRDRLIPIQSSIDLAVRSANATLYIVNDSHRLNYAGTKKMLEVVMGMVPNGIGLTVLAGSQEVRDVPSCYSFSR